MKVVFIWPSLDCPAGINHGLASLSAVLKKAGHEVSLIHVSDALWKVPSAEELFADIMSREPGILAFSATTQQFPWIKKMAAYLRPRMDIPIVIGGVHCTMIPEEVASTGLFDFVCVGEGENAFADLLDRIASDSKTDDCPNMYVCRDGEVIKNPVGPFPIPAELPAEDFELFDLRHILQKKDGWLSIITSRGCPFACSYCFNAEIVERYRQDGAISSVKEYLRHMPVNRIIEDIIRLGGIYPEIKTLIFDDDLFTINKDYVLSFCRAYREAGIKYPFVVNAHVKVFSPELADSLKLAGCRIVKFGLESGSERVRREILNRSMTNDEISLAVKTANSAGLHSSVFVMFGLPTETRADVLETLKLCAKASVGRFRWAMFYPYKGTVSYEICRKHGLLDKELLESSGNYFEASCLNFPPEHALYLDKLSQIAPWYVNAFSDFSCSQFFVEKVAEIESLTAGQWAERKKTIRTEERNISDELLAKGATHYSIRFSSVMGVHSDFVLKELEEQKKNVS